MNAVLDVTSRKLLFFAVFVKQDEKSSIMMKFTMEVTLQNSYFCIYFLFLKSDWLRALVFLKNLKYLYVKISVEKAIAGNFQIFESKRITNSKKIQKIKNLRKCIDLS